MLEIGDVVELIKPEGSTMDDMWVGCVGDVKAIYPAEVVKKQWGHDERGVYVYMWHPVLKERGRIVVLESECRPVATPPPEERG